MATTEPPQVPAAIDPNRLADRIVEACWAAPASPTGSRSPLRPSS